MNRALPFGERVTVEAITVRVVATAFTMKDGPYLSAKAVVGHNMGRHHVPWDGGNSWPGMAVPLDERDRRVRGFVLEPDPDGPLEETPPARKWCDSHRAVARVRRIPCDPTPGIMIGGPLWRDEGVPTSGSSDDPGYLTFHRRVEDLYEIALEPMGRKGRIVLAWLGDIAPERAQRCAGCGMWARRGVDGVWRHLVPNPDHLAWVSDTG